MGLFGRLKLANCRKCSGDYLSTVTVAAEFMVLKCQLMTNKCKYLLYFVTTLVNLYFHSTQDVSNLGLLSGRYFTQCLNDYE